MNYVKKYSKINFYFFILFVLTSLTFIVIEEKLGMSRKIDMAFTTFFFYPMLLIQSIVSIWLIIKAKRLNLQVTTNSIFLNIVPLVLYFLLAVRMVVRILTT
ncbi:MAG: hypothetical protein H6578_02480 [Chitinophagales bacterium]|nr:hypothetical protein [Chitinophagales bacterium]